MGFFPLFDDREQMSGIFWQAKAYTAHIMRINAVCIIIPTSAGDGETWAEHIFEMCPLSSLKVDKNHSYASAMTACLTHTLLLATSEPERDCSSMTCTAVIC